MRSFPPVSTTTTRAIINASIELVQTPSEGQILFVRQRDVTTDASGKVLSIAGLPELREPTAVTAKRPCAAALLAACQAASTLTDLQNAVETFADALMLEVAEAAAAKAAAHAAAVAAATAAAAPKAVAPAPAPTPAPATT
jgi:hypothetical protein